MDRARAGVDDCGIGALFGLYDWRFSDTFISYHTLRRELWWSRPSHNINSKLPKQLEHRIFEPKYAVSDSDFKKLVAILRLSVPYTGLICTARESVKMRQELIPLGVTQIDAGTRIGVEHIQSQSKLINCQIEQFTICDPRSLDDVVGEICGMDNIPSFCTAAIVREEQEKLYESCKSKFVSNYCIPNAILTLKTT